MLRSRDQNVLAVVAGVALVVLGVAWWLERERLIDHEHRAASPAAYMVDINSAQWAELAQLPNVGETLAWRIVKYREEHGPFKSIDELNRVRGIGPKTFDKLAEQLTIEPVAPGR